MLFSYFSCSKSLCIVICGTLIWNPGWNATRTVVYNSSIENRHQGSRSSSTPELKCLVTKLSSMNSNFSSLVMRSNMDYWRSFRIKISHHDTYTRNHYMWRHLLCIYLFTKWKVGKRYLTCRGLLVVFTLADSVPINTRKHIFILLP